MVSVADCAWNVRTLAAQQLTARTEVNSERAAEETWPAGNFQFSLALAMFSGSRYYSSAVQWLVDFCIILFVNFLKV